MEFVLWIGITLFVMCMFFGGVYPAINIAWSKFVEHDKRSIREIYHEL